LELELMLVALAHDAEARAAWQGVQAELDLDDRRVGSGDLFAMVGWRLQHWGVDDARLTLFAGARRRNWATSSLALEAVAAEARNDGPAPALVGRAATIAAYLPVPGLLSVGRPRVVPDVAGATLLVSVHGVEVRVPAPAEHMAWALRHRQWPDAAFALRHPEMSWERFAALPEAQRSSVYTGLSTLSRVVGSEVPRGALIAMRPPWWRLGPGRLTALGGTLLYTGRAVPSRFGARLRRRHRSRHRNRP
jgi:hypothetical protein